MEFLFMSNQRSSIKNLAVLLYERISKVCSVCNCSIKLYCGLYRNYVIANTEVQLQTQLCKINVSCFLLLEWIFHVDPLPLEKQRTTNSMWSAFQTSPCRENWGQSHMTGRFESLHSCSSPAAAPAPAGGQRSGSSWPHHRQRLQPRYLDAGCLPAPQTEVWRGCGWGEDAAASRCSSGSGEQKWRKQGSVKEKTINRKARAGREQSRRT